ncbi:P68 family surface lipoprotein [Mycoplasmoides pneumoniae]
MVIKKGFFALSSCTLGLGLILTACGARGKFDQVDDGVIKLATSIQNKDSIAALNTIYKKYKERHPGSYPVQNFQVPGGYSGLRNDIRTRLSAKDGNNFYNIVLNYPDVVSSLATSDMQLILDNVDTKLLSKNFLSFNERIGGVRQKGIYAIPISLSTELMVLNGPVLHYILNSAKKKENGAQMIKRSGSFSTVQKGTMAIDMNDQKTKDLWQKIENAAKANGKTTSTQTSPQPKNAVSSLQLKQAAEGTSTDNSQDAENSDNEIKKTWGEYKEEGNHTLKGYTFKASVFENWNELLDFSTRVANSFPDKIKNQAFKKATELQGVFGVDSVSGALFSATFAAGGGDYDKFFFNVKNGRGNFRNLLEKGSSYNNLQKVFNDYKQLISSNGLYINKGGAYSSNFLKFHQLAFSVGSSSGYHFAFAGESAKRLEFGQKAIEYPRDTYEIKAPTNSQNGNGTLLGSFTKSKSNGKEQSGQDEDNQTSETIELYKSSVPSGKEAGKNALAITNQQLISALENAAKDNKTSQPQARSLTASDQVQITQSSDKVIGYITTSNLDIDNNNTFDVGKLNGDKSTSKIIVNATLKTLNKINTLQSEEGIILPHPQKYKSTDPQAVATVQGPSIIGVHANAKENAETQKFINWFINQKETWPENSKGNKNGQNGQMTAAQYFAKSSGYVLPYSETFTKQSEDEHSTTKDAYKILKDVNDGKLVGYSDPSDFRSGKFRDTIVAAFSGAVSSKADFNKFFKGFEQQLGQEYRRG